MASGEYLIYRAHDHHWAIQLEGRFLAKFPDKSQAVRAAITLVHAAPSYEEPPSVICEVTGGERYMLWSPARNSYVSAA